MTAFETCVDFTLRQEGGFSDDPRDPGGATNFGITMAVLCTWRHDQCTVADVQGLTEAETTSIYGALYWNPVRGDFLPSGIDLMVFDMAVNAGVRRSAMQLQEIVGVDADGSIGPQTLAAVGSADPMSVVAQMADAQRAYYRSLTGLQIYLKGWLARTDRRQAAGTAMVQAMPTVGVQS